MLKLVILKFAVVCPLRSQKRKNIDNWKPIDTMFIKSTIISNLLSTELNQKYLIIYSDNKL